MGVKKVPPKCKKVSGENVMYSAHCACVRLCVCACVCVWKGGGKRALSC